MDDRNPARPCRPCGPLFGPQSANGGLSGLRFVVCPVRGGRYEQVAAFGRLLGLKVTVTTPEEHDREMAYVQALTHLIGRSLVNIGIPDEHLKNAVISALAGIARADRRGHVRTVHGDPDTKTRSPKRW